MATILPMPPTGVPSRGVPRTAGRSSGFSRPRRFRLAGDSVAEVADLASGIDQTGLFPASPAVADEFHADGLPKRTVLPSATARYDGFAGIRKGATAPAASCASRDSLPIFACCDRLGDCHGNGIDP